MSIFTRKGPIPGTVTPESQHYGAYRSITASAERVNLKDTREVQAIGKRQKSDKWQYEAWDYYNYIGEVHYSAGLIADVLSRINIYAAYVEDSANTPSPIQAMHKDTIDEALQRDAINAMRLLETSSGGIAGLLRNAALNFFISGECYIVQEPATYSKPERWQIRSVHELVTDASGARVSLKTRSDHKKEDFIDLGSDAYAVRLWRNHPQYSGEADSSLRSVLDLCEQLLLVARQERVTSRSALNNGILYIPDSITNLYQADADEVDPTEIDVTQMPTLEEEFLASVMESIENEMAGSTVAPYILRGPDDLGDKIKHIRIQREIDTTTIDKVNSLLDRILSGLAIPKDVAAGLSGVKYSNAIIVEETLYSSHIEPLIMLLVDELTEAFLRPVLKTYGYTDEQVRDIVIWYDPSAITAKPSKSEAATIGYQNKIISKAAWRRANGFSEADSPDELEKAERMMDDKGLVSEAVMERLLAILYPSIMNGLRDDQLGANDPQDANALEQALNGQIPESPTPQPQTDTAQDSETQEVDDSEASSDYVEGQ